MVCPNCQSTDIVELQNQHFCINCGKLIELATKKRGPGRPKADRLDKPKALTIQLAGKAAAAAAIDRPQVEVEAGLNEVKVDSNTEGSSTADDEAADNEEEKVSETEIPIIRHGFAPATAKDKPEAPEEAARLAEAKVRKRLQDIVPAAKDEAVEDENIKTPLSKAKPDKKQNTYLPLSQIVTAAWSEPWQGGPARILIFSATLASVIAAVGVALPILRVDIRTDTFAWTGFGLIVLAIALLFGIANTERAAFALRRYDHRPIPRSWLFGGALAALARQTLVLMAGLVKASVVVALAWYLGSFIPGSIDQSLAAVILLSGYFVFALLLLSIWAATGLGSAGVELGRMTEIEAIRFGWRSLWRHPELLGTRLVAALWLSASLAGIVAVAYSAHLLIPGNDIAVMIIGTAVLTFTAVLLGNFGAVGWRQASYRELVIMDEPADAIAMLSGHHNGAPRKIAKLAYVFVVTVLILAGIGAILSSF